MINTNRAKTHISIVLGSYNRLKFLKLTIDSIRKEIDTYNLNAEIIVVDGGSTDGSVKWLTKQKDIISIIQHNRGEWRGKKIERRSWGYFMNLAFKCAQGKYVCMVSDDCLIIPGAINNGIVFAEEQLKNGVKLGGVAFYWRNWPEQREYYVGSTLGLNMCINHGIYLNNALKEVGFIEEKDYFFYHADGDLSLKIWQKGYKILECKTSFIEHFSHANEMVRKSNFDTQNKDWETYLQKWTGIFYNPEINNKGEWHSLEFEDKAKTALLYRQLQPNLIQKGFSKLKSKIK